MLSSALQMQNKQLMHVTNLKSLTAKPNKLNRKKLRYELKLSDKITKRDQRESINNFQRLYQIAKDNFNDCVATELVKLFS